MEERGSWDLQREVVRQKSLRSKRLHSIPEVAEEELDGGEALGQRLRFEEVCPGTPRPRCRTPRAYYQEPPQHGHLSPTKCCRRLQRQRSSPRFPDSRPALEERVPSWPSRQTTKSPDSGLDCGSEEEGSLGRRGHPHGSPLRGPVRAIHCEGPAERRALAGGRKRTLTRQCSVEEDFCDVPVLANKTVHVVDLRSQELRCRPGREAAHRRLRGEVALSEGRLNEVGKAYHRDYRAHSVAQLNRGMEEPLVCVT